MTPSAQDNGCGSACSCLLLFGSHERGQSWKWKPSATSAAHSCWLAWQAVTQKTLHSNSKLAAGTWQGFPNCSLTRLSFSMACCLSSLARVVKAMKQQCSFLHGMSRKKLQRKLTLFTRFWSHFCWRAGEMMWKGLFLIINMKSVFGASFWPSLLLSSFLVAWPLPVKGKKANKSTICCCGTTSCDLSNKSAGALLFCLKLSSLKNQHQSLPTPFLPPASCLWRKLHW